jgi:hypothetical protein
MAISKTYSLEHDTADFTYGSACTINSTHVAVVYCGTDNYIYLKVFTIDGSYNISQASTTTVYSAYGSWCGVCLIDSTHLGVCHRTNAGGLLVATYAIDGSYNTSLISSLTIAGASPSYTTIQLLDSTHFVVTYSNTNYEYIRTISFNGSYESITAVDYYSFNCYGCTFVSMCVIDTTHIAVGFKDAFDVAYLETYTINGSYAISLTNSAQLNSGSKATYINIALYDSTHIITAFNNQSSHGIVKMFSFNGSYVLSAGSSADFITGGASYNSLVVLDATNFMNAYTDVSSDGFVTAFSIDGSYIITQGESLEYETSDCLYTSLVKLTLSYVFSAYSGVSSDGFVCTLSTGLSGPGSETPYTLTASSAITATIERQINKILWA